jgi:hypothetical protein
MMRSGFRFTFEAAQNDVAAAAALKVTECTSAELPRAIQEAQVAVPLMSRFDELLIKQARNLKMILQFGVGLEGVDIPAVCLDTILSLFPTITIPVPENCYSCSPSHSFDVSYTPVRYLSRFSQRDSLCVDTPCFSLLL